MNRLQTYSYGCIVGTQEMIRLQNVCILLNRTHAGNESTAKVFILLNRIFIFLNRETTGHESSTLKNAAKHLFCYPATLESAETHARKILNGCSMINSIACSR